MKAPQPGAHLKCLCPNAVSMGSNQVALDSPLSLDLLWDCTHPCVEWLSGWVCCRRWTQALQEGQAGKVRSRSFTLCKDVTAVCRQLPLDGPSWPRMWGWGTEGRWAGVVWWYICYTLADQEVKAEETFRQVDEASKWQVFVLMGDFSQPKIY